jgi:predicted secreted Zn-dependent protease
MCEINEIETTVDVNYTLPRWRDIDAANTLLRDKWTKYYKALLIHEEGHKNFGLADARDIEKSLLNMKYYRKCDELTKHANMLGHKILAKHVKLEINYDKKTNHGMNDGATFP